MSSEVKRDRVIASLGIMLAAPGEAAMDFLHWMKGWTKYALGKAGRLHWLWDLC
jgi:hypothetical protein